MIITRSQWLPVISCNNPGDLNVTYGVRIGVWGEVNPLFTLGFDVQFTPTYTTATGPLQITGFPPAILDNVWAGALRGIILGNALTWPAGITQVAPVLVTTGVINLVGLGSAVNNLSLPITTFTSGTTWRLQGSISGVTGP